MDSANASGIRPVLVTVVTSSDRGTAGRTHIGATGGLALQLSLHNVAGRARIHD